MVMVLGFVVQLAATVAHYALAPNRLGVSGSWTLPYALLFGINGKYLDVFALGMMAAVIYEAGKRHGNGSTKQTRVLARCAGVAGAIVLAGCVVWASRAGKLPGSGTGMTPARSSFRAIRRSGCGPFGAIGQSVSVSPAYCSEYSSFQDLGGCYPMPPCVRSVASPTASISGTISS